MILRESSRGVRVTPEDREDLWHLERALRKGMLVRGVVQRKIKGESGKTEVYTFKAVLRVEGVELSGNVLRIKGVIVEAPEEIVGKGKYQPLEIRPGTEVELIDIDEAGMEILREAEESSKVEPLRVAYIGTDEAVIAWYDGRLYSFKTIRRGEADLSSFIGTVLSHLAEGGIIGGPPTLLDIVKERAEERGLSLHYVGTPLSGVKALKDIIHKRGSEIIKSVRLKRSNEALEELTELLHKKPSLVSFRPSEDPYNVRILLVHEDRVKDDEVRRLMNEVKKVGGEVVIVPEEALHSELVKKRPLAIRKYPVFT